MKTACPVVSSLLRLSVTKPLYSDSRLNWKKQNRGLINAHLCNSKEIFLLKIQIKNGWQIPSESDRKDHVKNYKNSALI
jgi:hypothetical protein